MLPIFFYLLTFTVLGTAGYVYLRQLQDKVIPKDKYDEAWNEVFRRKRSITKSRKITKIVFLAIPVACLILMSFFWQTTCLFGAPCSWWEFTWIMIMVSLPVIIPFLVVIFSIWLCIATFQFFTTSKKSWYKIYTLLLFVCRISKSHIGKSKLVCHKIWR